MVAQWLCTVCTSQVSWVLFPATTGVFTFFYFASKLLKSLFNFTSADELAINLSAMKLSTYMALCGAYSVESDLQITSQMHTQKFKTLGSSVQTSLRYILPPFAYSIYNHQCCVKDCLNSTLAQTAMTMITGILWCNRVITTDQPIAK